MLMKMHLVYKDVEILMNENQEFLNKSDSPYFQGKQGVYYAILAVKPIV